MPCPTSRSAALLELVQAHAPGTRRGEPQLLVDMTYTDPRGPDASAEMVRFFMKTIKNPSPVPVR